MAQNLTSLFLGWHFLEESILLPVPMDSLLILIGGKEADDASWYQVADIVEYTSQLIHLRRNKQVVCSAVEVSQEISNSHPKHQDWQLAHLYSTLSKATSNKVHTQITAPPPPSRYTGLPCTVIQKKRKAKVANKSDQFHNLGRICVTHLTGGDVQLFFFLSYYFGEGFITHPYSWMSLVSIMCLTDS